MSKTAVVGTGVDFAKSGDGFIVAFLTDANDPAQLNIPAGNWNYEIYASMSSNGGTPQMYAELYKYDGTTFTLISTSSNEIIYDGTALNLYTFAMAVPATSLTLTDRLAVKLYSTNSGGKTTTIHTQDGHLCQIITTFSTGITALNGLTAQVQYFQTGTSGTDFNISSTTATHTFNIPDASATARGLITTGTQTIAGTKTFSDATKNNGGIFLQNASSNSLAGYMNLGGLTNGVKFTSGGGISNNFTLPSATGYTFTFPNATGTLAMLEGAQTFSGAKTFSSFTKNDFGVLLNTSGNYTAASGYNGFGGISNGIRVVMGQTTIQDLVFSTLANYTYTFPNATGTLALTSDLTDFVTLSTAQTISGIKTFSSSILSNYGGIVGTPTYFQISAGGGSSILLKSDNGTNAIIINTLGKVDFGSTIGNGTYTYTLPSATGTIALVGGSGVGTVTSVAALTIGTSGTDLSSTVATSTTTPVITLNVPTASATNRGALSSADWTTFNNKQSALTNPITGTGTSGQVAYFNGTTSITSESNLFWDATNDRLGIGGTPGAFNLDVNGTARVQGQLTTTADASINGLTVGRGAGNIDTNTALGISALSVSSGTNNSNTAIGRDTITNTTGTFNTALGRNALRYVSSGAFNTGIGGNALMNVSTSSNNTGVGVNALQGLTTGGNNTSLGFQAGGFISGGSVSNITGSNSIFIGYNAFPLADAQTNQIVIGYNQVGLGSNTTVIGNSSTTFGRWYGRLLLGTSTDAGYQLDVNGTINASKTITARGQTDPTSGVGMELFYRSADTSSYIQSYDRTNNAWKDVRIYGSTLYFGSQGSNNLTIASTGAATFSSSVTATSESFITSGDGAGKMLKFTGNTTKYNFMIAVQQNVNNALEITPSTAAGGSTFSTPALTIASTGAATFSSSVTAGGDLTLNPSGSSTITQNASTGNYNQILFKVNGTTQSSILALSSALYFSVNGSSTALTLASTQAATFSSSVTATGFFESSDSRLKTLIQDNYQTKGIASITPKLYTKNGKVELGYYAQDFVGILDSAVSKGSDDMLSLSYREVHTAKIYALEQEIKELKAKMN
jgi:hypothetical protein